RHAHIPGACLRKTPLRCKGCDRTWLRRTIQKRERCLPERRTAAVWELRLNPPVEVRLLDVRQQIYYPIPPWELFIRILVVVKCQRDLLEVVLALHPRRRFAHLLDGRQQHTDEYSNDGDDHQQLNQREACLSSLCSLVQRHRCFSSATRWFFPGGRAAVAPH